MTYIEYTREGRYKYLDLCTWEYGVLDFNIVLWHNFNVR